MGAPNCATILLEGGLLEGGLLGGGGSRGGALSAERAYQAMHPMLQQRYAERRQVPQMLVAAVAPDGSVRSAVLSAGSFLVIGRHSQCTLQLEDPNVSLRQLVVHWSQDKGVPLIRLWDLHTGRGFCTEDGRLTRAVAAERLLLGSVGRFAIGVLPIGPEGPLDDPHLAWESLPERRFAAARLASDRPRGGLRDSTVTHTLPPVVFGSDPVVGRVAGMMRVEGTDGNTECRISEDQLDRWLLFGRYERCQLALVGDHMLSRVHLMVVRVGEQLWAVDTASTNGTRRNGAPVSASPLQGAASLLLGRECLVRWKPAPTGALA
jgi:hypothetical protein